MMKISSVGTYALGLTLVTTIAGCSGASSGFSASGPTASTLLTRSPLFGGPHPELAVPSGVRAGLARAVPHRSSLLQSNVVFPAAGVVWVTDQSANKVWRCTNTSCVPKGTGWNDPNGIAADASNRVYIADTGNSRIVRLRPNGNGTPFIFPDPGYYPSGVAVATNGAVCATNIDSTTGGPGNIVCYNANGTPLSTICCNLSNYYFDGFDSAGNLYADGYNSLGSVVVEEVANAATVGTTEVSASIANVLFPGGIEVGRISGYLMIADQTCPCIRQYTLPGYSPGSPASFTLIGVIDPVTFGLKPNGKILWAADAGSATADAYRYSSGVDKFSLSGSVFFPPSGLTTPIGEVYTPYGQY